MVPVSVKEKVTDTIIIITRTIHFSIQQSVACPAVHRLPHALYYRRICFR